MSKELNITERTVTFYDFIEMCREIDRVLGYDQRGCEKHFHPDTGNFDDWCKTKGYGQTDSDGEPRNSSRVWFAEFMKDVKDGKFDETPYMDFWHWQIDHCVDERTFRNDVFSSFSISMECAEDAEDWQKEIQQVWHDTFKHLADDEGDINIWVSW